MCVGVQQRRADVRGQSAARNLEFKIGSLDISVGENHDRWLAANDSLDQRFGGLNITECCFIQRTAVCGNHIYAITAASTHFVTKKVLHEERNLSCCARTFIAMVVVHTSVK